MGFFGMSSAGKNARTSLNNLGGWNQTQANDWLAKAQDLWGKTNQNFDWATEYWKNRAGQGAPSPSNIRGIGQEILPVDEAVAKLNENQGRRESATTDAANAGTAAKEQIDYSTGHLAEQVAPTWQLNQDSIETAYGNVGQLADTAYSDLVGTTNTTFDKAEADWNAAYNELIRRNAGDRKIQLDVGDDMARRSMGYLDEWAGDIETLKPGGEFAAARAARAFAPSMAAVSSRLRRAGVDPNSVQAASLIGGVETDRARAMDDAFAEGQETYVNARGQLTDAKTNLLGDYRDYTSGVIRDALGNEIGVGTAKVGGQTDLTIGRGDQIRDAINDRANVKIGNEGARTGATVANAQQSFDNAATATGRQADAAVTKFGVDQQGLDNFNNLMANADKTALTEVDLSRAQYLLGNDWAQMDQTMRDNAAAAIAQLGSAQMQAMFNSGQMAQQFGQEAADLYEKIFITESANAGWGLKGLMGLAGSILGGPIGGAIGGGRGSSTPTRGSTPPTYQLPKVPLYP